MFELKSFAKINLGLEVTGKRPDGYHELRTVFQTIGLHDIVRVTVHDGGGLVLNGSDVSIRWDESNTVARAYRALQNGCSLPPDAGLDIFIQKNIPAGSGLGGGSSNAAVILMFMNEYFGLQVPLERMVTIAAGVGADVPFFLLGGTVLAEGIGEKMTPLDDLPEILIGLVVPDVKVSTSQIFSRYTLTSAPFESKIMTFFGSRQFDFLENSLESVTFELFPEIKHIKDMMLTVGCSCVLMSGSGSAVYAVLEENDVDKIKELFPNTLICRSIDRKTYQDSVGAWPSGKASVFGADIRRFESSRPSHIKG